MSESLLQVWCERSTAVAMMGSTVQWSGQPRIAWFLCRVLAVDTYIIETSLAVSALFYDECVSASRIRLLGQGIITAVTRIGLLRSELWTDLKTL